MTESHFLSQLQVGGSATLLKKTPAQVIFLEFFEIFENTIFTEQVSYGGLGGTTNYSTAA